MNRAYHKTETVGVQDVREWRSVKMRSLIFPTVAQALVGFSGWWLILACAGTVAQLFGTTLSSRGAPPDSPWPDDRGHWLGISEVEVDWIDDYIRRETDRIWGTALINIGVLLLLAAAVTAPNVLTRPVAHVLAVLLLCLVCWSSVGALLKTQARKTWKRQMLAAVQRTGASPSEVNKSAGEYRILGTPVTPDPTAGGDMLQEATKRPADPRFWERLARRDSSSQGR